jgi:prepilin-type N-terminal cleavage/methylation domain-containing protein
MLQGNVVKRTAGFTLLELMISIALIGILLALAGPSFRDFTSSNRVTAANNDLITAFNLARGEASRRSTPVTICASADGTTCGDATNWASGWIVFQNPGTAGVIGATPARACRSGTSRCPRAEQSARNVSRAHSNSRTRKEPCRTQAFAGDLSADIRSSRS